MVSNFSLFLMSLQKTIVKSHTKPQMNLQLLPCSVWRLHFFWSLWGDSLAAVHVFFSTATETGERFVQHTGSKGPSGSKSGFVCCGSTSQGRGFSRGREGMAAQNSIRSCMALAVRPVWCSAPWVLLLCGNYKGHASRQMGIFPVIR